MIFRYIDNNNDCPNRHFDLKAHFKKRFFLIYNDDVGHCRYGTYTTNTIQPILFLRVYTYDEHEYNILVFI